MMIVLLGFECHEVRFGWILVKLNVFEMNSVENVVIDNDDVVAVVEEDSWIGVWRKIC
jgi:hypothetical protein